MLVARYSPVLGIRRLSAPRAILPASTRRRQHPSSLSTAVDGADNYTHARRVQRTDQSQDEPPSSPGPGSLLIWRVFCVTRERAGGMYRDLSFEQ